MNEFGSWDDFVSIVNRQGFAFNDLLGQGRGPVNITRNGGILFPSTQVASSNVNVLDDYEEGSWTPSLAFGGGTTGITYTLRQGEYTKIGRKVNLEGTITLSNKGSSTGVAVITGAPFSKPLGGTAAFGPVYWTTMTSSLVNFTLFFAANSSNIGLYGATAAATGLSQLTDADFANTSSISFSLAYHTST